MTLFHSQPAHRVAAVVCKVRINFPRDFQPQTDHTQDIKYLSEAERKG